MAYECVVTGATGYIASELVKQLLEKGYNVKGSVRSLNNKEKIQHLINLGAAFPGKLTLHEADLLSDGSFDDIVKGTDLVFHTASPFVIRGIEDPQIDLVDPAVKGTKNVIGAAMKSKDSVRRVVLTSSTAAVVKNRKGPGNGSLYTEEDWNDESSLTESPYMYSKAQAERAAWDMAKEAGLDLVTINPSLVLGPVLTSRADATSIILMKEFVENTEGSMLPRQVDVRDVARAHVLAAEVATAKGRFIVSHESTVSTKFLSDILSEHFPQYRFPAGEDTPSIKTLDNSKVRTQLGLQLRPLKETYIDMVTTLIQQGIAVPVAK
ncbi:g1538 [Coccomyxa elongata]